MWKSNAPHGDGACVPLRHAQSPPQGAFDDFQFLAPAKHRSQARPTSGTAMSGVIDGAHHHSLVAARMPRPCC
jgi:hypothetical protein